MPFFFKNNVLVSFFLSILTLLVNSNYLKGEWTLQITQAVTVMKDPSGKVYVPSFFLNYLSFFAFLFFLLFAFSFNFFLFLIVFSWAQGTVATYGSELWLVTPKGNYRGIDSQNTLPEVFTLTWAMGALGGTVPKVFFDDNFNYYLFIFICFCKIYSF